MRVRNTAIAIQLLLAICIPGFCFIATAADQPSPKLTVLPGFKVTPIYSVPPEQGSWICMAVDPKGRILISPQIRNYSGATPFHPTLLRLTMREGKVSRIEKIQKQMLEPQGLLYAFDSLYVNGTGPEGLGIYRLRQNGDDDFDDPELLRPISYDGEHGSHALVLGPDEKIYVTSGYFVDHAAFAENKISAASPFQRFGQDHVLPMYADADGFSDGSPAGTIARMDANGRHFEIFCGGTRNIYDIAFSPEGELFGFDNDHESDWGTPWYRPCRLYHLVSAGDYGFRNGTGKLPDDDQDTLPAVKDVGIGAPTGIRFGTGANLPEKYRRALFMLDWAYGRIFAAHLLPKGSSYTCDVETVVRGTPLNVTDLEVTPGGSMYFITGGRNTRSTLYRLEYTNSFTAPSVLKLEAPSSIRARSIRHELEAYHGGDRWFTVDHAWPYLGDPDRNIRYAARIAIESQPVRKWKDRALSETNPVAALTGLLALARVGEKVDQPALLEAAGKFPLSSLSIEERLLKLRALEISFARQGRPAAVAARQIVAELSPQFPSTSEPLTRESCQVLLYLGDSLAIARTLQLAHAATTRESQMYFLYCLSSISNGWTPGLRKDYLQLLCASSRPPPDPALSGWMKDAGIAYSNGANFDKYLKAFRTQFAKTLLPEERNILNTENDNSPVASGQKPAVRNWKTQDFAASLGRINGRNVESGRAAFESSRCTLCHRFQGTGGSIGPDLTAIAKRATARDILESILAPSTVIPDPYRQTTFVMKNGDVYTGKILQSSVSEIKLLIDAEKNRTVSIHTSDIESRQVSKLSPMPEGLVNHLTEAQILDLVAYLLSGENANGN